MNQSAYLGNENNFSDKRSILQYPNYHTSLTITPHLLVGSSQASSSHKYLYLPPTFFSSSLCLSSCLTAHKIWDFMRNFQHTLKYEIFQHGDSMVKWRLKCRHSLEMRNILPGLSETTLLPTTSYSNPIPLVNIPYSRLLPGLFEFALLTYAGTNGDLTENFPFQPSTYISEAQWSDIL